MGVLTQPKRLAFSFILFWRQQRSGFLHGYLTLSFWQFVTETVSLNLQFLKTQGLCKATPSIQLQFTYSGKVFLHLYTKNNCLVTGYSTDALDHSCTVIWMLRVTSQRPLLADLIFKLRMRLKSTDLTRMVMESLGTSLSSKPCKRVSTILRTSPSFVLVDKWFMYCWFRQLLRHKNILKNFVSFSGGILSDVNFTFIFNTKFQNELLNRSSNEFRTMENKIQFSVSTSFFEVIY